MRAETLQKRATCLARLQTVLNVFKVTRFRWRVTRRQSQTHTGEHTYTHTHERTRTRARTYSHVVLPFLSYMPFVCTDGGGNSVQLAEWLDKVNGSTCVCMCCVATEVTYGVGNVTNVNRQND